ncbi:MULTISPECIES: AraC family transcriptional regulator [unclassified Pseudoalteromonas]|jgi:AraC-like DNA-binding protein|uniref:AraC family transcriptional regulator n=1 Tax=unclassified Pseudoalteromonas TaxID=194690 RepID=UPI001E587D08|nr:MULTISPECIES: AraC family transcriptional regulator [unclassified Pseudoalteromonas]MCC9662124.1 AraC family transcriptional regulator [Pseudoalteromonas sp. MB41]MCO7208618.1 AraC family transcriptional regulator [Pseudoalteromonas sp. CnMc7-37]
MNRPVEYTTLAAWPLAICKALESQGIDPNPLLIESQLNRSDFINHPDGRIDIRQMTRFWELVESKTNDPSFGLKVSSFVQPMHFRALGLLMLTSDNLENALLKMGKYSELISNSATIRIERKPSLIGFCIDPILSVPIHSMAIDSFFATLVHFAKQLGAENHIVHQVELFKNKPKNAKPWEDYFQAEIVFSASQNCLWLKRDTLQRVTMMGDTKIAAYNETLVKDYILSLNRQSFSNRVTQLILAQLENSEINIAEVAAQLNLSERSLRRHLKEEDTNFREILQKSRMEMAKHYLTNTDLSITQIALKTGFNDTSNFSRAFTRWFTHCPTTFRKP